MGKLTSSKQNFNFVKPKIISEKNIFVSSGHYTLLPVVAFKTLEINEIGEAAGEIMCNHRNN